VPGVGDQTITELDGLNVTNLASDADLPPQHLTFALLAGPVGVALNPINGVLTWTPARGQGPSTNRIVVKLSDDGPGTLSATKAFTVMVNAQGPATGPTLIEGATIRGASFTRR
jgi:hypothetical protein